MIYLIGKICAGIFIGLVICCAMIKSYDRQLQKEMETEKKAAEKERKQKAENEAWVNELIANIKNQPDELAY